MKRARLISMLMVFILILSSMSFLACTKDNNNDDGGSDDTKTVLAIGNRDRGFGHAWLDEVAREFEIAYANWQGENGKIGVEVEITNKVDEFNTMNLTQNIAYNGFDLYVLDELDYLVLQTTQHDGDSVLADMTDIVLEKNYDDNGNIAENGTKNISDLMVGEYRDYYNLGSKEQPCFYAIPFVASPAGGIYDADVFDKYALYYKADGTIGAKQKDIDSGNCGKGPDGELGTYDDGMPSTWEEFKDLLYNMAYQKNITPFMWSGNNDYPKEYLVASIYANYEGANNYNLLYTLSGEHSELGDIDSSNAWKLGGAEGRVAAVRAFADIMADSKYYSPKAMSITTTHTMAQMLYVKSIQEGTPIAMFAEGSYWEEEAREYFDDMGKTNPKWGFGKRNFKLLPIPNFKGTELYDGIVSQQEDNRQVLVMQNSAHSSILLSAQAEQMELAKEFVKFIHSRDMLVRTTQIASFIRPYEYKFTPTEKEGCTKFMQSIITMMEDKNTDIVWCCGIRGGKVESNVAYFKHWFSFSPATSFYNQTLPIPTVLGKFGTYTASNWIK